jgi:hypothetical protein
MTDPLRPHQVLDIPDDHFDGGRNLTAEAEEGPDKGLPSMLRSLSERPPILSVSADYTLTKDDEGKIIEVDPGGGTVTVTLPPSLDVGYFVQVRQVGTGTARIAAGSGATLNVVATAASPTAIAEQWASAAVEVRASSTWIVTGALA